MTQDIRYNTISGLYENEDDFVPVSIHFSEWWNGEGMTVDIDHQKHINLHSEELKALCVIAIATGMVDAADCVAEAEKMKRLSAERDETIRKIGGVF